MKRNVLYISMFCLIGLLSCNKTEDQQFAYLFGYWTTESKALHYAYSDDGLHWNTINDGRPVLHATTGNKSLRDFFINRGHDGYFHLISPDLIKGRNGSPSIIHFRSKDLIHWEDETLVKVMTQKQNAICLWGPEFHWNSNRQEYLVWWACPHPIDNLDRRTWHSWTRDFKTYTTPDLFFDPGYMVIDATMLQSNEKYYLYFKDNRRAPLPESERHVVRLAVSDDIDGPYEKTGGILTPNWIDGPSILKMGDQWYLYYEFWKKAMYAVSVSSDLLNWTPLKPRDYRFPTGAKHGTFLRVTQHELSKILTHFITKQEK